MSNIKLPFLRNDAVDGKKRLWRVVPIAAITAAAVGAVFIGGVAGPSSAADGQPARSAWVSGASGDTAAATTRYISESNGRYTFDSAAAAKAGVSSQAVSAESTVVAGLNSYLARDNATAYKGDINTFETSWNSPGEQADAARAKGTTITLVPGFTVNISSAGVVIAISKADVTELENIATFAKDLSAIFAAAGVATVIASALAAALQLPVAAIPGVVVGAAITFVGAVIGLAGDVLKICTAADGSATFTVPWFGIPSCSAQ